MFHLTVCGNLILYRYNLSFSFITAASLPDPLYTKGVFNLILHNMIHYLNGKLGILRKSSILHLR